MDKTFLAESECTKIRHKLYSMVKSKIKKVERKAITFFFFIVLNSNFNENRINHIWIFRLAIVIYFIVPFFNIELFELFAVCRWKWGGVYGHSPIHFWDYFGNPSAPKKYIESPSVFRIIIFYFFLIIICIIIYYTRINIMSFKSVSYLNINWFHLYYYGRTA